MNRQEIISLESLMAYYLSNIDFSSVYNGTINYSFGDESEVVKWVNNKDVSIQTSGNLYKLGTTEKVETTKYPLIWMNSPVLGINSDGSINQFKDVEIIITTLAYDELNPDKWRGTMPLVTKIANYLISKFVGYISILEENGIKKFNHRYFADFSIAEYEAFDKGKGSYRSSGKAQDRWDAVKIICDIVATKGCLTDQEIENKLKCITY